MEKNLSTVIFDFGNVLVDLDLFRFDQHFRELINLPPDMDIVDERAIHKTMSLYEHGHISTEVFINRIIKMSRRSIQALDVISCWNSMLVGIQPETLPFLKDLKRYYQTYILSNTNPLHVEWIHSHLKQDHGVEDFENEYLHGAFYSHELKMAKPELEIYHTVQSKIDVSPEEIFFIDDREENIHGAREAGWSAALHDPRASISNNFQSIISMVNVK